MARFGQVLVSFLQVWNLALQPKSELIASPCNKHSFLTTTTLSCENCPIPKSSRYAVIGNMYLLIIQCKLSELIHWKCILPLLENSRSNGSDPLSLIFNSQPKLNWTFSLAFFRMFLLLKKFGVRFRLNNKALLWLIANLMATFFGWFETTKFAVGATRWELRNRVECLKCFCFCLKKKLRAVRSEWPQSELWWCAWPNQPDRSV